MGRGGQCIIWARLVLAAVDCANGRATVTSYTVVPLSSGLAAPLHKYACQDYIECMFYRKCSLKIEDSLHIISNFKVVNIDKKK